MGLVSQSVVCFYSLGALPEAGSLKMLYDTRGLSSHRKKKGFRQSDEGGGDMIGGGGENSFITVRECRGVGVLKWILLEEVGVWKDRQK